ncbi:FAD-binding oxidoreductase [Phanerochaete sordida]|uniref:FAD-binding oxidoreductase n=1 Tax=Phanerochaete sordida TaxID=48140 RepID=A0A9P3G970_9APHY|nr:FAD-binding oxidoreductase [Phanerochaete sordida]
MVIAQGQMTANDSAACAQIQRTISTQSSASFPGQAQYIQDQMHYYNSSSQPAVCTVEPGSPEDVSRIIQIVAQHRTPFAVKGGGHATNPNFSSTSGVLVSMSRFNTVQYHASNQTADIGTGMVWDAVYTALEPFNVTVLGGRVPGIGVAGLTLGGGYSWLTNQHGLVLDTVVAFEVVLPSGERVTANAESEPDLFFALKGGYNNFGIVTQMTFRTFPIANVWGGNRLATSAHFPAAVAAINNYVASVTDPRAAMIISFVGIPGALFVSMDLFYDGPAPPPGIFDEFLAIPAETDDIGVSSYAAFVGAQQAANAAGPGTRGLYDTATIAKPTPPIIDAIVNETTFRSEQLASTSAVVLSYSIEVFLPDILAHAPEGSSAYPPTRRTPYFPLSINVEYTALADDPFMAGVMASTATQLGRVAETQEQQVVSVPVYGNYATTRSFNSERTFGASLPRLRAIKATHDPFDVMGLAGGWKVLS